MFKKLTMFNKSAKAIDTKKAVPLKTRRTGKRTFIYVMYKGKKTDLGTMARIIAEKDLKKVRTKEDKNRLIKTVYMRMFTRYQNGKRGADIYAPVAK